MAYKRIELDKASIDHQLLICDRVAAKLGDQPRLAMVDTYGCQQNEADSERLAGLCRMMGYRKTDDPAEAELILVNTCAVREHAEKRALSFIGQYKKLKENAA